MNMRPELVKFGAGADRGPAHLYPDVVYHDADTGPSGRLIIAAAGGHVALVQNLVSCLQEPLRLLYVLVVPRGDAVLPGRYEAPTELSHAEVFAFFAEFAPFLEHDGRHHLWVGSPGHGTVVYDRHNLIYAYGPLDCFEHHTAQMRRQPDRPDVPVPHWHAYHPEFDGAEDRLLRRFAWVRSELRQSDQQ